MKIKTISLFYFGLTFLIFTTYSCRKKELRDIEMQDKPLHCFNNEKDFDETVIDGGGSCGCEKININGDCLLAKNEIKIEDKIYSLKETNRDTLNKEIVIVNYIFNNDDLLNIKYHKDVIFNSILSYNSTNLDNNSIDVSILSKNHSRFYQDLKSNSYIILNNGCNSNLVSCDAEFITFGLKVKCKLILEHIFQ
ncbi:MAG: hypothetical protein Q8K70_08020 [Bacteroidota bacterium]|nr:hypothetical protein [Bacteroidota bacterium]